MPKAWEDITEVGLPTMLQEHSGEPLTLWETPSALNEYRITQPPTGAIKYRKAMAGGYGVACSEKYILVREYESNGSDAEIIILKKRL